MHHPTDRITHTTAFVTPVVEHWLKREIAQQNIAFHIQQLDTSHSGILCLTVFVQIIIIIVIVITIIIVIIIIIIIIVVVVVIVVVAAAVILQQQQQQQQQ